MKNSADEKSRQAYAASMARQANRERLLALQRANHDVVASAGCATTEEYLLKKMDEMMARGKPAGRFSAADYRADT